MIGVPTFLLRLGEYKSKGSNNHTTRPDLEKCMPKAPALRSDLVEDDILIQVTAECTTAATSQNFGCPGRLHDQRAALWSRDHVKGEAR